MPPLPHYTLGTAALQALLGTYYAKMKTWLQDAIIRCQPIGAMKCPVQIGLNHPNTWNHAKIIAVDDTRVITGGHNFWAGDYLGAAPVHDVSGLFEGPAARAARQFCEKVWHLTTQTISLIDGKFTSVSPIRVIDEDPIPPAGNVEMLSLGRLGRGLAPNFSISTNASVTARIVALCKAKNLIRISQQSLLGFGLNPYEFYTCLAICPGGPCRRKRPDRPKQRTSKLRGVCSGCPPTIAMDVSCRHRAN
jgi:hypothetical protein